MNFEVKAIYIKPSDFLTPLVVMVLLIYHIIYKYKHLYDFYLYLLSKKLSGFNDNGSGVASVLEAARVLAAASCYRPQFSVYFVAFDGEESGCRGSQEFIYSHLKPHLDATGGQAQGAFILDTILNYDKKHGSQSFSKVCI